MATTRADRLKICLAQLNLFVGDVDGNATRVVAAARDARADGADLVMFPELALAGYPPEDLLFHSGFRHQVQAAIARVCRETDGIDVLFGYPEYDGATIYNSAALVRDGRVYANHRKQCLPNYKVFDEKRYFTAGRSPTLVDVKGARIAILVCEDVWEPLPAAEAKAAGAELVLVVNASPYQLHKQRNRQAVVRERALDVDLPIVYVNLVGGQDELVFDGNSFVMDADGTLTQRLPAWREAQVCVEFERRDGRLRPVVGAIEPELSEEASVYSALVLGVRDYVTKHRFPGIVLGLSGGVDSALTLAIAVDALGAKRVRAVMMPSRYTADISLTDAAQMAKNLGVDYTEIPIEPMYDSFMGALCDEFEGLPFDLTEENLQARIRGTLLMALSNKFGSIVLTTGNKSEMGVGYSTLYGDMAGGFAVLKDVPKTLVYRLAHYRNGISPVIPQRIITRAPSAELRPGQTDQDSLPPYEILDAIMQAYVEDDSSPAEIVAQGYAPADVRRVVTLIDRNEYKRRQSPVGVRITQRGFGKDRRYPITSRYRFEF